MRLVGFPTGIAGQRLGDYDARTWAYANVLAGLLSRSRSAGLGMKNAFR
jgi:hypothetical protein